MKIAAKLFATLGLMASLAVWPGVSFGGPVEAGRVMLTPSTTRVAQGGLLSMDVVIDFSDAPPIVSGGFVISWDPTVFTYTSWTYSTSTIGDDPAFRPTPSVTGSSFELGPIGGFVGLTTPGIVGTITFQASALITCQSPLSTSASAPNPWLDFGANEYAPDYLPARVAVGNLLCTSASIDPEVADMPGRCIAKFRSPVDNDQGCEMPLAGSPLENDWVGKRLFEDLPVDMTLGTQQPLADHMARYCEFDRVATGIPPVPAASDCNDLEAFLETAVPGSVVESASMAASGQASLNEILREDLRDFFVVQAGKPNNPLPTAANAANLWILDSNDGITGGAGQQLSSHGPTLREIAKLLRSGGPVSIGGVTVSRTEPALPFTCFDEAACLDICGDTEGCPTQNSGGFMGTPESVARSLHNAILRRLSSGNTQRLVMNLSVGWLPVLNEVDGTSRPGYSAFVDVLREAACLGVLVIASAGNEQSGPSSAQSGLLFPAAQTVDAAPSEQDCLALGYAPNSANFPGQGAQRSLIYPVGAVNADGTRLLARPQGEPTLTAFGDHANVGAASIATSALSTLTGSSVSAVVASTAAALAWAYDPGMAPHEVMELLYASSKDLGRPAEVCFPAAPCPNVRRVSVCAAVAAACAANPNPDCPAVLDCPTALPTQLDLPFNELDAAFDPAMNADVREIDLGNHIAVNDDYDADCNHAGAYTLFQDPNAASPLNPCPQDQFFGVQSIPWAKGQPEGQSCPECGLSFRSPGTLYVHIRDNFGIEFEDPTLLEGTLLCRDPQNGHINAFRLPDVDPTQPGQIGHRPGDRLLLTNLDQNDCTGADVRLAFSVADDLGSVGQSYEPASVVQQLLVIREDADQDNVPDFRDNCTRVANAGQRDTNNDGFGNACDPDIAQPNNCLVEFTDLGALKAAFFSNPAAGNWNPDADFNADNFIDFTDLGFMKSMFFGPPGPSALQQCE